MSKKMCQYYKLTVCGKKCPENTNSYCEIVQPKYKRLKAFARVELGKIYPIISDEPFGKYCVPCTILINTKYLKGGKN